jgi:hypothetical protein
MADQWVIDLVNENFGLAIRLLRSEAMMQSSK